MYHIDTLENAGESWVIRGWCYDPTLKVRKCYYDSSNKRVRLEGFGLESPDLEDIYGKKASRCRFEFRIPGTHPNGYIALTHGKGQATIIPLAKLDVFSNRVRVFTHHFVNRMYFGRFEILGPGKVKKVILGKGTSRDFRSVSVSRRKFYHEPDSQIILFHCNIKKSWDIDGLNLFFVFDDGSIEALEDVGYTARQTTSTYLMVRDFFSWINEHSDTLNVVEIGSRARSGNNSRSRIDERHHYVGTDLMDGENVDVVADVHQLSSHIEPNSVDALFGLSVVEHVAMPWKMAIELNRVLKVGGRAMFMTHQTWPLHDYPFDFWRFSEQSWNTIFNHHTGFRVVEATMGEESRVLPELQTFDTRFGMDSIGFLSSCVVVEKTGDTELQWDVPVEAVYQGHYPSGTKVGLRDK